MNCTQYTHRVVFRSGLQNQVGNTSGISKRRHLLSNLIDGKDKIVWQSTHNLRLGLVTNHDNWAFGVNIRVGVRNGTADELGKGRVNTTAKTLVRREDDEKLAPRGFAGGSSLEDFYWNKIR